MTNYYSLLKISVLADAAEIHLAFSKFRAELSKYNQGVRLSDEEIQLQCPEIWEAFLTLIDPAKRKDYDDELKRQNLYEFKTFNINRTGSGGKSMPGEYSRIKPASGILSPDEEIYVIKHSPRKSI